MSPKVFFSKRALCERYGIHEGTLNRWVRKGRFPKPVKLGGESGACRWPADVVEQHEAGLVTPTSAAA